VLKLNWILSIPTGVYSYEQMVSAFLRRPDLGLLRATFSHHEWCGNTWKALRVEPGHAALEYRTYWEGQGEGTTTIPWDDATVASDALPVLLRALPLDREGEYTARVAPTLIGSRLGTPDPVAGLFRIEPGVTVPGRSEPIAGTRVDLILPGGHDRWWLETAFPHRTLRWERADGAVYRLSTSRRLAYWTLNGPGDEKALVEPPPFDPPLAGRPSSADGSSP
jgi:hypothetical protein